MAGTVLKSTSEFCNLVLHLKNLKNSSKQHTADYKRTTQNIIKLITSSKANANLDLEFNENPQLLQDDKNRSKHLFSTPFGLLVELGDEQLLEETIETLVKENISLPVEFCYKLNLTSSLGYLTAKWYQLRDMRDIIRMSEVHSFINVYIDLLAKYQSNLPPSPCQNTDDENACKNTMLYDLMDYESSHRKTMPATKRFLAEIKPDSELLKHKDKAIRIILSKKSADVESALKQYIPKDEAGEEVSSSVRMPRFNLKNISLYMEKKIQAQKSDYDLKVERLKQAIAAIMEMGDVFKHAHSDIYKLGYGTKEEKSYQEIGLNFFNLTDYIFEIYANIKHYKQYQLNNSALPKSPYTLLEVMLLNGITPHVKAALRMEVAPKGFEIKRLFLNIKDTLNAILICNDFIKSPDSETLVSMVRQLLALTYKLLLNHAENEQDEYLIEYYRQKTVSSAAVLLTHDYFQVHQSGGTVISTAVIENLAGDLAEFYYLNGMTKKLYNLFEATLQVVPHDEQDNSLGSFYISRKLLEILPQYIKELIENNNLRKANALCALTHKKALCAFSDVSTHVIENFDAVKKSVEESTIAYLYSIEEAINRAMKSTINTISYEMHESKCTMVVEEGFDYKRFCKQFQIESTYDSDSHSLVISDIFKFKPEEIFKALEYAFGEPSASSLVATLGNLTVSNPEGESQASSSAATGSSYAPAYIENTREGPKDKTRKRNISDVGGSSSSAKRKPSELDEDLNLKKEILSAVRKAIPEGYGNLTVIEFTNQSVPDYTYFYITKNESTRNTNAGANTRAFDPENNIHITKSIPPFGRGQSGVKINKDGSIRIVNPAIDDRPTGHLYRELDISGKKVRLYTVGEILKHKDLERGKSKKARVV